MARIALILVFAACTCSFGQACDPNDPTGKAEIQAGLSAATTDIARGLIKYEIVGLPGPQAQDLAREAKARYMVTVVFHGCVPGPRVCFDAGYLEAVKDWVIHQYG